MRKGFTLVELSIVLIIIGLIIGGVMKGKDLINSASQKKIYNTWIKQWQVQVNAYQDRTGAVLGDGKNNGGTRTGEDGRMDNVNLAKTKTVQKKLRAIGLDVPVSNIASSDGASYSIKGKYTTSNVRAYLYYLHSHTDNTNRNCFYIVGMPTDVAIAFDKISDGQANSQTGSFRRYPDNSGTNGVWPDAQTTKTVNVSLEF